MTQTAVDPLNAALAEHQAGNRPLAEQLYRQILAETPERADAWHLLGALYVQSGEPAEAIELIHRAIQLNPTNPDYFNHLGAAYGLLGKNEEAIASLRRAVQLAPHSSGAHYNLGTALLKDKRLEEAVASYRHAVAADPRSAEAYYNLGNTLRELSRIAEAETSYRDALRIRPNYVRAMINLGLVLRAQERLPQAIVELRRAIEIEPNYPNSHLNLGTALRDVGEYTEAEACLRRAVALDPASAEAHNNLGTTLQAQGRFDEALVLYERALELDPKLPDAHFSRGVQRLRQGDFERGFPEYEWRWKCAGFREGRFPQPLWDGSSLVGKTILLFAEQGLGDTLHFVRYAQTAKERGGRVIVECQEPLVKILGSCPGIDVIVPAGAAIPDFDVQASLMSLPGILCVTLETASTRPYLFADPGLSEQWRRVLAKHRGFRVGICWQGNPKHMFDTQRSFALERLAPLGSPDAVRLFSLQKGDTAAQIEASSFEVIDLGALDEASGAFMDTAAVMENLDLVITSDTAVAHLAGALGVPVWVALSFHADWRWLTQREDSPWYPTMRLFRQRQLGEWSGVFERMAAEIEHLLADRE